MKVKYVYVIQNRKYTGGAVQGKKSMEHRSGHILSVLSLYQRYLENIICVYDLIFDTLCITTPVLDKCVKSIMEDMFTNKNYRKKRKKIYLRYLQTPRLLITTIHVQNRKYTGGAVQGKKSMEHRSGHILSVLSLYQRYFCIV
jgi:hypothetical protein